MDGRQLGVVRRGALCW